VREGNNRISVVYPNLFREIANHLDSDAWVYLIGGENLRLKGYKDNTKDCDIVVTDVQSFEAVISALIPNDLCYKESRRRGITL